MYSQAKISYTCRAINFESSVVQSLNGYTPKEGDVAMFRIIQLGKHTRIHNREGVNQTLCVGDEIIATFGNRYASNQFEGRIPSQPAEELHLLGQGGVVGIVGSAHAQFSKIGPTRLALVGYVMDAQTQQVVNSHQDLPAHDDFPPLTRPKVILSVGSSMDSGKTTTAAYLTRGLTQGGHRVAYLKLTGTAYAKDPRLVEDLGAVVSLDFSHFGYPSTYLYDTEELIALFDALLGETIPYQPDYVIVEIADGIVQRETKALLMHSGFASRVDGMILSVGDSLGAWGGLQILGQMGWTPLALAGCLTAAPLMISETAELTQTPILTLKELASPISIAPVLSQLHKTLHTRLKAA